MKTSSSDVRNGPVTDRLYSVLIVSYRAADHLIRCLAALEVQTLPRHRFEVIVIENGSNDDTPARIRSDYPWVRLVEIGSNIGFAAANNLAAGYARGSYWVLLNPDTLADPFWLEEIDRAVAEHPGLPIVSKLLLSTEPGVMNSGGLFLTRDGRGADRSFREPDDGRYERGGPVFAGCAAALAVPAAESTPQLFDPDLFLYCEDLEYGWRNTNRGMPTLFAPRAVVRHAVGASAGDASAVFWFYSERNRTILACKHGDVFLAVLSVIGLLFRTARALAFAVAGHPSAKYTRPNAAAVARAAWSFASRLPAVVTFRAGRTC